MSDTDKMMAFGSWLTRRKLDLINELAQMSVNCKLPEGAIRVKGGAVEAVQHVLEAFTDLYKGDLNKFMVTYLGQAPEEEEESTDGST